MGSLPKGRRFESYPRYQVSIVIKGTEKSVFSYKRSLVKKDRLIVGIACLILAAWIFVVDDGSETVAPAITLTILGIITVVRARK